ncbi:MAG: YbaK/EbsC family protein [Candidatus Aenigmarchaeota archaeon]|nr:YbaK/EbsC family protein [Candidatus Aenigmarchaeota archaeon]
MKSIEFLKNNGIGFKVIHLKEVPKSAQDVERLFGCSLHQVLKTLVFVGEKEPLVVVLPGDEKAGIEKLRQISGQKSLRMAKPDEVERITGYSVGGVCPFAIENHLKKIIDKSVFDIDTVNIGSGKAEIGIELKSADLRRIWDGAIDDISE